MHRRAPAPEHDPQELTLSLDAPASGGTCVARFTDGEGKRTTYFVRGGLPGEQVRVRTTGAAQGGRVGFATVVEVLAASPDRVRPPCEVADRCGGCDLQHVQQAAQLRWKAHVLADQLQRIGGLERIGQRGVADAVVVQSLGDPLGWRTRAAVDADAAGHPGFHASRSSEVVAVAQCPVLVPELQEVFGMPMPPGGRVHVSSGDRPTMWSTQEVRAPQGWRRRAWVTREALGRQWRVATDGFWQAHSAAADVLADQVARFAELQAGETALDLYAGVGLFAAALTLSTDPAAAVIAVEGDAEATRLAKRNLHDLPGVTVVHSDVRRYEFGPPVAVTVLDPPRAGAGSKVMAAVAEVTQRAVVHVGCDGAATARDLGSLVAAGWQLADLRAFDLFPMTHHLETVALLRR